MIEILIKEFLSGMVISFFMGLVKDTVWEKVVVLGAFIGLAVVVFTQPEAFVGEIIHTGLGGWIAFFLGIPLGRFCADALRKR